MRQKDTKSNDTVRLVKATLIRLVRENDNATKEKERVLLILM